MKQGWLISALAALAVTAVPAMAEEMTPEAEKPQAPPVQVAPEAEKPSAPGTQLAGAGSGTPGTPMPSEEKKPDPPPPPRFTYGGQADGYFLTNLNDPPDGINLFRAFDYKDEQGPHLGLIDIWMQYGRDPVGARVDFDFGPTAHLVNAFEPTDDDIWAHIQQAYISVNLNKAGTTYVDFGKWVTTAGAEVIEPRDNWLYSRGLLFNLAIPFYHLGIRGYHYLNSTDYVGAAVHRGWNAVSSPDHDPGFAIFAAKAMNPQLTLIGNYYGGEEFLGMDKDFRHLVDLIALYNPGGKLAYTANFDFVTQDGMNLYGLSAQAKYALNARQYIAARGEFLIDDDEAYVGTDTFSVTLGFAHLINKYLQTRVEFRQDFASDDVFPEGNGRRRKHHFSDDQPTFLISLIAGYP
jgi:putative OmpL-like beta-barrel porin-2